MRRILAESFARQNKTSAGWGCEISCFMLDCREKCKSLPQTSSQNDGPPGPRSGAVLVGLLCISFLLVPCKYSEEVHRTLLCIWSCPWLYEMTTAKCFFFFLLLLSFQSGAKERFWMKIIGYKFQYNTVSRHLYDVCSEPGLEARYFRKRTAVKQTGMFCSFRVIYLWREYNKMGFFNYYYLFLCYKQQQQKNSVSVLNSNKPFSINLFIFYFFLA